jgi:uncharacterized membrane protein (DUF485 family)
VNHNFFQALLDFSFSRFVATKVVGIIYFLAMLLIALIALVIISAGFSNGFLSGLGSLIVAPIIALIYLLLARVGLESLIAGIRTAENSAQILDYLKRSREENN